MSCVALAAPLSNLHLFQVHPCRHRADVGLQLRSGQRSRQGALLLLRLPHVQGATALGATLDLAHIPASATKGSRVYLRPTLCLVWWRMCSQNSLMGPAVGLGKR